MGVAQGVLDVAMNLQATASTAPQTPILASIHAFFYVGGLTGATVAARLFAVGCEATVLRPACPSSSRSPHRCRVRPARVSRSAEPPLAACSSARSARDWLPGFLVAFFVEGAVDGLGYDRCRLT